MKWGHMIRDVQLPVSVDVALELVEKSAIIAIQAFGGFI